MAYVCFLIFGGLNVGQLGTSKGLHVARWPYNAQVCCTQIDSTKSPLAQNVLIFIAIGNIYFWINQELFPQTLS